MGDLILGIVLLAAILDGWRRGVIKLLGGFGGIIVGIFVARRVTPVLLGHLGDTLGGQQGASDGAALAQLFFTNSAMERLLELVVFIVVTAVVTWLVRLAVGAFGSVVNATPLVGFVSRVTGACLETFAYAMLVYFLYVWFLPWLIGIIPEAAPVNGIFTSSQYVLQPMLDIGSLVWHSTWDVVNNLA